MVVFICISLIMSNVEHLFLCLLAMYRSSLDTCLLRSPTRVLTRWFLFLMWSCMSCLYILKINPLSVVSLATFLQFYLLFICFWLCWVFIALQAFSAVAVHGLLIAVASLVAAQALGRESH